MDSGQETGDARWLSYDEIADMRGIDRASAIRMVRRKHWSKRDSNDGTTRVAVPGAFFRAKRTKDPAPGQIVTGQPENVLGQFPDKSAEISALSDHVTTLREQLSLTQRMVAEREEQLRAAHDQVAVERTRAAVAEAKLEAAEAALAEARRPFWRRWIG